MSVSQAGYQTGRRDSAPQHPVLDQADGNCGRIDTTHECRKADDIVGLFDNIDGGMMAELWRLGPGP